MNMQRLPFPVAMTLICAVSAFAQDVNTDYDRDAKFHQIQNLFVDQGADRRCLVGRSR